MALHGAAWLPLVPLRVRKKLVLAVHHALGIGSLPGCGVDSLPCSYLGGLSGSTTSTSNLGSLGPLLVVATRASGPVRNCTPTGNVPCREINKTDRRILAKKRDGA